ncbi:MAG TPA: sodium:solute symporter family protein [Bryobacteraceae bacterium]|jgi:Na+/proline symporter|nr:sodium:solute symporter family protein [Bryobacteraceae bacterium]
MTSIHLKLIDWIVTIGYLCAITIVGLLAGRGVKTTRSYFLGGRKFNKWLMIGQSFGTGTHAEMPVSLAGAVYATGLSGIWFQWKNLFVTPFYWLFAPLFRRVRRTTTAEVMEDRYGSQLGIIYAVFALGFFTINMASMLKGAAKVISQATGGDVPVNALVIAMTVVFLCYSTVGGLVAAAWTDFLQGFLILVLSFLLIPLGWTRVGGIDGMRQILDPDRFSLATPHGIGVYFILMLTLNGLIGIVAQPHMIASVGTGKDENACRTGFLYGNFTKRFCTLGWVVIGLMVLAMTTRGLYGVHSLVDPEEAFGFACRHLLFPGGVGLLIASVLAANMAACSAFMVNSGALFTRNLYQKCMVRSASDRHYLLVGRLSGIAITLLGVLYAVFLVGRVLYSFLLTETMSTFVGIGLLGGIVWPRANRWGALGSLLVPILVNFGLYFARGQRLDQWDPSVFLASLLAGISALILVSLLTKPEPEPALQSFFRNLQTPSEGDVHQPSEQIAGSKQYAAASGKQLLVVNLLHLRRGAAGKPFVVAYREDLAGFIAGWAIALGMLALAWLLFKL